MFCNLEMFCRCFMAFTTPWIIFEGVIKGTGAEMLHVNATAMIGGNATIQWNVTKSNPVSIIIAEIWQMKMSNFSKYKDRIIRPPSISCNNLKQFDSQNIKVTAMKDGSLKELYQIRNTNESTLYGRITFTGQFDNGQLWWTILHVVDADLDLVYLLCLRKGEEKLTHLAGYARIIKMNESTIIFSTVQPTNQPKPTDKLSGAGIAGIVIGCLAIVTLACIYGLVLVVQKTQRC